MERRLVREIICGINSCNTKVSNLEITKKLSLKSGRIHIWRQRKLPNFKDLPPPVLLRPKPFLPFDLGRPSLNEAPLTYTHTHTHTYTHTHIHTHTHTHTPPSPTKYNKQGSVIVNERNQSKSKTKSHHIRIDHAFYRSI